jgi:type VI protein secretion system component VasF
MWVVLAVTVAVLVLAYLGWRLYLARAARRRNQAGIIR